MLTVLLPLLMEYSLTHSRAFLAAFSGGKIVFFGTRGWGEIFAFDTSAIFATHPRVPKKMLPKVSESEPQQT